MLFSHLQTSSTFFIAKKKHAASVTVEIVDDVDMTDAEENIRIKGMIFPNGRGLST